MSTESRRLADELNAATAEEKRQRAERHAELMETLDTQNRAAAAFRHRGGAKAQRRRTGVAGQNHGWAAAHQRASQPRDGMVRVP